MKQNRARLAPLLLALALCLAGCGGGGAKASGSVPPSASPAQESPSAAPQSQAPESAPPAETGEEQVTLTVDGQSVPACRYVSPLGYALVYPEEQITVKTWETGENYTVSAAPGTYLAVSVLGDMSVEHAAEGLQFEYGIEDTPKGFLFGAAGYAGVRMVQQAGGLSLEYILLRHEEQTYLVERAIFTGGEEQAPLLQAMLDSFELTPGQ